MITICPNFQIHVIVVTQPELLRREWDSDICRLLPESYQLLDHAQKTSQFSLKVTSSPVMPGKVIKGEILTFLLNELQVNVVLNNYYCVWKSYYHVYS